MTDDKMSISFNCKSCGTTATWPEDTSDDTMLVCKGCGTNLATLGDMKKAAMQAAKDKVTDMFKSAFKGAGWKT